MPDTSEKVAVTIKATANGYVGVDIDGVHVPANGTASISPGQHVLGWAVTGGQPGSKLTIQVTKGGVDVLKVEDTLDKAGESTGREPLNV